MAEAMADGELESPTADGSISKTLDQVANPVSWRDAPVARQVAVVVVLAAAIAVGVAAALWSGETPMTPLFADMAPTEMGKVTDALKVSNTEFRIDASTGALLVPAERAQAIRMQLASQGLPETGGPVGLEMLSEQQDLSTSQFVENARYLHALETELARSVSSLRNVKSARVHLAMPKESVFVRRRTPPSASVVVALYRGRKLSQEHVASIVNLVSASVPSMSSDHVTVVDQHGSLLTESSSNKDLQTSTREYEYTRRMEADYAARIVNLLEPVVGAGRVRAQVTAELDFNRTEVTSEAYEPEGQVVRSEQIAETESSAANALGIPGALTNQPPGEGT
ncbi:MAG: flagellar basal-body MS-ring/collar protein FliF, partial [Granulosicoccaceae bacterium]